MPTWRPTFLVEPFPDTPWDRRELERWRQAAPGHAYADVARRRSVAVSLAIEAEEEGDAIAGGRARVDAGFPPWRYHVQNPPSPGLSPAAQRARAAGVAAHLRDAGPRWFGEPDAPASPSSPPDAAPSPAPAPSRRPRRSS